MTMHHAVSNAGPYAAAQADADVALRRALEAQVAALVPIASSLHSALAHPSLAPAEWRGPASGAYDGLEARLRSRLADADGAVSVTLQSSRLALGEMGG